MAGKNDGPSNTDFEWRLLAGIVVAAGTAWLVWTYAKPAIVLPLYALDWVQIKAIQLVRGLREGGTGMLNYTQSYLVGKNDPWLVEFNVLWRVKTVVGEQLMWPFMLAALGLGALVFLKMPGNGLKRPFSLAGGKGNGPSLMQYQAQYWRPLKVNETLYPDRGDPNLDQARTPMEWLRDNSIRLTPKDGLDRKACEDAFKAQLGDMWHSPAACSLWVRCLLVIIGLHADGANGKDKAKLARQVRYDIADVYASVTDKAKRRARLEEIVAPHMADAKLVARLERLGKKHAYVSTALIAMLIWAREKAGVLPSAEFPWVKAVDRSLWYALNNVGRRSFHIEGAGAMNHFFAEKAFDKALITPKVEQAVGGVVDYLETQSLDDLEDFFKVRED